MSPAARPCYARRAERDSHTQSHTHTHTHTQGERGREGERTCARRAEWRLGAPLLPAIVKDGCEQIHKKNIKS